MMDKKARNVFTGVFVWIIVSCILAMLGLTIGRIMMIPLTMVYIAYFVSACRTVFKDDYVNHQPPHTLDDFLIDLFEIDTTNTTKEA